MLRLSLLLVAGIGWLLASVYGGGPLQLNYFYQNMFLSNGAEVVFEFKIDGCDSQTQLSGTFDFGDNSAPQTLTHINCERWRIPHTYYTSQPGEATLTLTGVAGLPLSIPVDLNGPPKTPPKQLIYSGGGSNPGDTGAKKNTSTSQPQSKTYQLILKNSGYGISGYVAIIGSSDSGFSVQNIKVKPIFLTKGFHFDGPGTCTQSASGKCFSFRAELGDPEGCLNLQNKVMAEITLIGNAKLVLDKMDSQDAGPVCHDWVNDNKPIKDISGNFELK